MSFVSFFAIVNKTENLCFLDTNGIPSKPISASLQLPGSTDRSSVRLEDITDSEYPTKHASFVEKPSHESPPCRCSRLIKNMIKGNKRLLFAIRQIVYVARQLDKTASEKESWLIAATILDRVFLVFFFIMFIIFSLINFLW